MKPTLCAQSQTRVPDSGAPRRRTRGANLVGRGQMNPTGEHLYQLVQAYSALGEHRTGTPVDQATIAWFATELGTRGARVDTVPYRFERYAAHCRLTADAAAVDALPLYYEAVG